jgi:serine/threonine protein kinase
VFEDDNDVHIVMELCEGGALTDAINTGFLTDERSIARIVSAVLRFIAQCHAKGLVYRDCKPDNFLFVTKDAASPIKATDFGLSIRHSAGENPLTSRSGTPAYMAPEVCCLCPALLDLRLEFVAVRSFGPPGGRLALALTGLDYLHLSARVVTVPSPPSYRSPCSHPVPPAQVIMQSYSSKADLWSVGMVTYQLLTGRFPFCENIRNCSLQDVWKAILTESGRMHRHIDKLRGTLSDDACDFLSNLLHRDPSARFSATQALQHKVRCPLAGVNSRRERLSSAQLRPAASAAAPCGFCVHIQLPVQLLCCAVDNRPATRTGHTLATPLHKER